jgi:cytochrome c-type biogenesis protein CcmH/NrfG
MSVFRTVVALMLALAAVAAQAHENGELCQKATPAVTAAHVALAKAPASLAARFRLADAFVEASCYDDAVHALEDGENLHGRNPEYVAKLRTVRSLVNEQSYFEGKDQAEQAAKVARYSLRCSKLGDLDACDEALKLKPDDATALIAKGDALLKASRPGDAAVTYRHATKVAPGNTQAAALLAQADSARAAALSACQNDRGDVAIKGCQAASLKGSNDEFSIQSRLAVLYRERNEPAPALSAYIAANVLKPGDVNVARGIVAVTDAGTHDDAVALAARGSALMTLNRGNEALTAFREAQRLAPAMPELKAQIAAAQKLSGSQSSPNATTVVAAMPKPVAARTYSNAAEPTRSF